MRPKRAQTDYIVWHCSATKPDQFLDAAAIDAMHKARGWQGIGYHLVIRRDGVLDIGEPISNRGAHVKGYNSRSVSVCMVGGLDEEEKPSNNFTQAQWHTAFNIQAMLTMLYPKAQTVGHRDLSPDIDGDGEVEEWEWLKMCPCFDAREVFTT